MLKQIVIFLAVFVWKLTVGTIGVIFRALWKLAWVVTAVGLLLCPPVGLVLLMIMFLLTITYKIGEGIITSGQEAYRIASRRP